MKKRGEKGRERLRCSIKKSAAPRGRMRMHVELRAELNPFCKYQILASAVCAQCSEGAARRCVA
eukprot:620346-Rhodomonas_salina.1